MPVKCVALIGLPASGKTTLARAVIARLGEKPVPGEFGLVRWLDWPGKGVCVLGAYPEGETFGGTDRLSMAVQPKVIEWLRLLKDEPGNVRVFWEGDRLTNQRFFTDCLVYGIPFEVFCAQAQAAELDRRHKARGDTQSLTWLKGRETKLANVLTYLAKKGRHPLPLWTDTGGESDPEGDIGVHLICRALEV